MLHMDIQKSYDSVELQDLEDNIFGLSFPNKFISWAMTMVKTVSYWYKFNHGISDNLQAKRGLRQGDLLSLLLFVLVMEYLHKTLYNLGENPNFNFHSKCEKLKIINWSFVYDILLFTKRDVGSDNLSLQALTSFLRPQG